jgi:prepilin-type N-terminal cleavage/methylation domain-containing protein
VSGSRRGLTLLELLLAATITALIAAAAAAALASCLQAQSAASRRAALYNEGIMAMERITGYVRISTFLLIPNNRKPVRNLLVFSGTVNDDNDYYFNDPLFPRIDEDTGDDMTNDGVSGILGYDITGGLGGLANHLLSKDDDEDLLVNEDPLDGIDNDGDGNIDEDVGADMNGDGAPGIAGMDDNGDGIVDNGAGPNDDDEDGLVNEDPLNPYVFVFNAAAKTLTEIPPPGGAGSVISTHATAFTATYEPPSGTHAPRVVISLTLQGTDGTTCQFSEYAYPRNVLQKTGKRCR